MSVTSIANPGSETNAFPELSEAIPEGRFEPEEDGKPKRLVFEADEIVFKAGNATVVLRASEGGVVEIRGGKVRLIGDQIHSDAASTNTLTGRHVVSESLGETELLGKLVRIDGQCVKIS